MLKSVCNKEKTSRHNKDLLLENIWVLLKPRLNLQSKGDINMKVGINGLNSIVCGQSDRPTRTSRVAHQTAPENIQQKLWNIFFDFG